MRGDREHGGSTRGRMIAAGMVAAGYLALRELIRTRRMCEFRGKVVLIIGGSRGLGLELARAFAREGARLAISARDAAEVERARVDLAARGATVIAVECDVTDHDQVDELVRAVRAHYGHIDVLVNDAGVIQVGPMRTMTDADYEEAMRVHFWGPLYAMRAVAPEMRTRGSGRIVNIASVGGKISVPHLLPYCASKFALAGLSEGWRAALARDGVFVTTVYPGLMRTGSPRNAYFKGQYRDEYAWFSIAASLPALTTSSARAAARIVAACRRGDAELVFPTLTRAAVLLDALLPETTADVLALVDRVLPGGRARTVPATASKRGAESESVWSPSPLTALTERAALRNNEIR